MSSAVCHRRLQPCPEPPLRKLNFAPPTSYPSTSIGASWDQSPSFGPRTHNPAADQPFSATTSITENDCSITGFDFENDVETRKAASWSLIGALPKVLDAGNENAYVHPMAKHSPFRLSQRSLEICTECLGSETGSDFSCEPFPSESADARPSRRQSATMRHFGAPAKKAELVQFPPPLTSISGCSGCCIRVQAQRDGGRLVMSATEVTGAGRKFQVERGGGRLRLHLVGASAATAANAAAADDDEEEEEEEEGEETGEEREGHDVWSEDMEGNCDHAGGEFGTGKQLSRPRRCWGGNQEMARWGGSVTSVATS